MLCKKCVTKVWILNGSFPKPNPPGFLFCILIFQCQALGDVNKSYVLDVNCEQKRLKALPNLEPFLGKPLVELDLKLNKIKDLPGERFEGLRFKTLHKEMLPLLDVSMKSVHVNPINKC